MILVVTVLEMLLDVLYVRDTTAFNATLSMSTLGFYVSYLITIIHMTFYGRNETHGAGSFNPGRLLGPITNIIAFLWIILTIGFQVRATVVLSSYIFQKKDK